MKKLSWWCLCLVGVALLLSPYWASAEDVIKFGVSQPLSSGDYKSGELNVKTAEMFIDELNAKGGLLGKKVELVKVDDEGKPAAGVTAMQRLVNEGVSAVVGVWHSSVVMAQKKIINRAKVPMILHYSWADGLTSDHSPYVYRISPFNSEIAQLLVPYLKKNFKTVALMYETTDFGIGFMEALKKYAEPEGIKLYTTGVPAEATDLKPQLLEFKAKKPYPELLILAVNYQPTNLAPKQAAEIGLYPKTGILCAWDWPSYPDFWEVVGEAGVGVTFNTFESKKLKLSPLGEHFKKEFFKRYNFQPPVFLFFMYDGMTAVAETIKRIGSADPEKIAAALIDTKFEGTTGPISFVREDGPVWNQWMGQQLFIKKMTEFKQSGDDAEVIYP